MLKIVNGIVSSVNAAIAVKLYLELIKKGIDPLVCVILSVILAVVVAKVLEYILVDFPKLFYCFRKLAFSESSLEGIWLLKINADKNIVADVFYHYAIAHIFYSKEDGKYHYEGKAYDNDCQIKGDWYSTSMTKDTSTATIRYFYAGNIYTDGIEKVEGVGMLKFDQGRNNSFSHATDYFIEINREIGRYSCFAKKIPTKLLKKYMSGQKIAYEKMIKNYDKF